MSLPELFIIAVGLSMDAFAVAICKGLSMGRVTFRRCATVGLYFGGFQALMPLLGYLLGAQFARYIEVYDHWIAFVLLAVIGGRMFKESFDKGEPECASSDETLAPRKMLPLALATSIDALAIGVSFAFLQVQIAPAVAFIGAVTFVLSFVGVAVGSVLGMRFKSWAEKAGGMILILMGLKILLEHLGYL